MIQEHVGPSKHGWVEQHLATEGVDIFEFEGYSIEGDDDVTMVIDRRKVDDVRGFNAGRAWREYTDDVRGPCLEAKQRFAELAGCTYHLALYDDERVRTYSIHDDTITDELGLVTYDEFGEWLFSHNDTEKLDKGFIHGLPDLDNELRDNGTPWPSDLDGFWYDDGDVRALIEFQTTKKAKVANHSNNRYFSDDYGRWHTIDRLRRGVDRPLLIIVWSPNDDDEDVKVKKIETINFNGSDRGLKYEDVTVLEQSELVDHLETVA